ncbi:hypothetical protein EV182_007903, partial [Spiromyces aspiralis]
MDYNNVAYESNGNKHGYDAILAKNSPQSRKLPKKPLPRNVKATLGSVKGDAKSKDIRGVLGPSQPNSPTPSRLGQPKSLAKPKAWSANGAAKGNSWEKAGHHTLPQRARMQAT